MEYKKFKVVWLCYFTNKFVQDNIKPWKRVNEFAPWITHSIPLFENDDTVELHIVSQHEWICGYKSFKSKGVIYHFFNSGMPVIGRHWPRFFRFDVWSDFLFTKMHISQIVKKINPDIIHLRGAENEFSTAITQFYKKYPVFITIQGFVHKSSDKSFAVSRRKRNESRIFKMFNHYGYSNETMCNDIREMSPNAVLHWHDTSIEIPKEYNCKKKHDLVFFAKVCKEKGIEDLLNAVSIIKKEKPDISLCVIGGGKTEIWKKKAEELNITENVYWAGFLPTQKDVHDMASTARISVLPTYHDMIPGTIIESMFLKLPVVAYDVGSIHEVNKHGNFISLVKKFDINGLVESILLLLNDEKLRQEIAEKVYTRVHEMVMPGFGSIKEDILKAYSLVIKDFHKK